MRCWWMRGQDGYQCEEPVPDLSVMSILSCLYHGKFGIALGVGGCIHYPWRGSGRHGLMGILRHLAFAFARRNLHRDIYTWEDGSWALCNIRIYIWDNSLQSFPPSFFLPRLYRWYFRKETEKSQDTRSVLGSGTLISINNAKIR